MNVGPPGGFDAIAAALASEARRAADFSGCQAAVERQARRVRGGGRRAARQRAKTKATGRQRCLKLYGRTPGPVTGVAARSISQNTIELSFLAAGSDGSRAPAARNYLIKQSPRPIRTARDFGRAQTLCRGSCRFFITKVGGKITLSVNDLRPRRSYYYAIAARDNVSGRLGPRSQTVGSRTP